MTATPASAQPPSGPLPGIEPDDAAARGLETTSQLATRFHMSEHRMKRLSREPRFPAPTGLLIRPHAGRRAALYPIEPVREYVDAEGSELRTSTPPRVVGLRTAGVGGYVYRDPRRTATTSSRTA